MYGAGSWCWQCRHQESKKDWFNQVKNYPRIAGGIICQHPHRARLLEPVPGGGRQQERHQDSPGQGACHQPAGGRRPGEAGGGQHLQHSQPVLSCVLFQINSITTPPCPPGRSGWRPSWVRVWARIRGCSWPGGSRGRGRGRGWRCRWRPWRACAARCAGTPPSAASPRLVIIYTVRSLQHGWIFWRPYVVSPPRTAPRRPRSCGPRPPPPRRRPPAWRGRRGCPGGSSARTLAAGSGPRLHRRGMKPSPQILQSGVLIRHLIVSSALPQLVGGSAAAAAVLVCGFHKSEVNNLNGRAPPPPSFSISSSNEIKK